MSDVTKAVHDIELAANWQRQSAAYLTEARGLDLPITTRIALAEAERDAIRLAARLDDLATRLPHTT